MISSSPKASYDEGIGPVSSASCAAVDSSAASSTSASSGMSAAGSPVSESSLVTDEGSTNTMDASSSSPTTEELLGFAPLHLQRHAIVSANVPMKSEPGSCLDTHKNPTPKTTHSPFQPMTARGSDATSSINESETVKITCGGIAAKLILPRFLCPGIHQVCVELNGEMISPKQLTILAAKDKQKDWKGAIKINRQPLRVLFEKQSLDFYRHSEFCSGRCVGKNRWGTPGHSDSASTTSSTTPASAAPANPPKSEFKVELPPPPPHNNFFHHFLPSLVPLTTAQPASLLTTLEAQQQMFSAFQFTARQLQQHGVTLGQQIKEEPPEAVKVDSGILSSDRAGSALDGFISNGSSVQGNNLRSSNESPSALTEPDFRSEASSPSTSTSSHSSLIYTELISEILSEVRLLESSFTTRSDLKPYAARKLSELVRVLDIKDRIDQRLLNKRCLARAQTAMLSSEIEELKRRTSEQKRRQLEIKRRSEIFDQLIGIKEPRLSMPSIQLQRMSCSQSDSDTES